MVVLSFREENFGVKISIFENLTPAKPQNNFRTTVFSLEIVLVFPILRPIAQNFEIRVREVRYSEKTNNGD